MKKSILAFGMITVFGFSAFAYAGVGVLKSDDPSGKISSHLRVFTMTVKDCVDNIASKVPGSKLKCDVNVTGDSDNEIAISFSHLASIIHLKGKSFKVFTGNSHAGMYRIFVQSLVSEYKYRTWGSGSEITKEDFASLIEKFLEKVGSDMTIKYLKID